MKLVTFFNTKLGTTFEDESAFSVILRQQSFKKGAIITDYGQIERNIYFINSGLVQLSALHDGEEKIIDFFFSGSFVCAYTSFLKQELSDIRVTTLSKCETEVIKHQDLQDAYKISLIANQLGRLMTEQAYMQKTKREKDFLTKSAQERYQELISSRPDMLKLIPINKIAKYLGIHPESLSRIRKLSIS